MFFQVKAVQAARFGSFSKDNSFLGRFGGE